ncbi:MAG: exodeoxyribonuclease VII large subunit [Candidatus Symbiobacter sp.]|nr:exodeoxyribonuclease VII large subunit [Candidatus Symbiobacter sp.]
MENPTPHPADALTVSEAAQRIKRAVESLGKNIRIRGEISGIKRHAASGHVYFDLKDENAVLNAVCFKFNAAKITFVPSDGQQVTAIGRLTTYEKSSRYQIIVENLEPLGAGALLAKIEERKRRLAALGLFDAARKPPLPFLPEVIGIITSESGAVLHDIMTRLEARFPRRVILWPVAVQGEAAAAQITAAIEGFNRFVPGDPALPRPDVLIVARGGGSIEDLMPFNEENVVRAAAASRIPLVAAVGHETDVTLIDHAAARRAPTPTAAAEMVTPLRSELQRQLAVTAARLPQLLRQILERRQLYLHVLAAKLLTPDAILANKWQYFDGVCEALPRAWQQYTQKLSLRLQQFGQSLPNPQNRVDRSQDRLRSLERALAAALRARHLSAQAAQHNHQEKLAMMAENLQKTWENYRVRLRPSVVDELGNEILAAAALRPQQKFRLSFKDGQVTAISDKISLN